MHKKSFKSVKKHSLSVDDGIFDASYKENISDNLGMVAEVSLTKQEDGVDLLLTNRYYPKMRLGTREQDNQQAVFSLSKHDAKKLRDYLNDVL